jgi:hypothetical protein
MRPTSGLREERSPSACRRRQLPGRDEGAASPPANRRRALAHGCDRSPARHRTSGITKPGPACSRRRGPEVRQMRSDFRCSCRAWCTCRPSPTVSSTSTFRVVPLREEQLPEQLSRSSQMGSTTAVSAGGRTCKPVSSPDPSQDPTINARRSAARPKRKFCTLRLRERGGCGAARC